MASELFEKGMKVRKEVMGADYVERSMKDAAADDFMAPMLELTTEYCWGKAWSDPTLPPKTRSMLNIAMLSAMGKATELKSHVRGALNNGVTKEEIRAIILHVAVYAGIPAGIDALRNARDAIRDYKP